MQAIKTYKKSITIIFTKVTKHETGTCVAGGVCNAGCCDVRLLLWGEVRASGGGGGGGWPSVPPPSPLTPPSTSDTVVLRLMLRSVSPSRTTGKQVLFFFLLLLSFKTYIYRLNHCTH